MNGSLLNFLQGIRAVSWSSGKPNWEKKFITVVVTWEKSCNSLKQFISMSATVRVTRSRYVVLAFSWISVHLSSLPCLSFTRSLTDMLMNFFISTEVQSAPLQRVLRSHCKCLVWLSILWERDLNLRGAVGHGVMWRGEDRSRVLWQIASGFTWSISLQEIYVHEYLLILLFLFLHPVNWVLLLHPDRRAVSPISLPQS